MFTPLEIQPRLSFVAQLRRSRLTALVNLLNIFNFKSLTGFINLTNKIFHDFWADQSRSHRSCITGQISNKSLRQKLIMFY